MSFIKSLLDLFSYLFVSSSKFEPILLLVIGCSVFSMLFCLVVSFLKGRYSKNEHI